ncbi:MAG TPA: hypothetical protein VFW06_01865 [Acidimicrobiia bacterium]|nr:hypothetical protein [Acidimicrobiia bacterium]
MDIDVGQVRPKRRLEPTSTGTVLALTGAIVGLSVLGFAAIRTQGNIPVGLLTRDPAATTGAAWYLGLTSQIGMIGWAWAAAVFGFAALLLTTAARSSATGTTTGTGRPRWALFLALGAAWSTVMLVDDTFLLHDDLLKRALGSETPIVLAYAALLGAWLALVVRTLPRVTYVPLVVALSGFAVSALVDFAWTANDPTRLAIEDGAKFLGIWSWALFAVVLGATVLTEDGARAPIVTSPSLTNA